jgi:hypothetical protein
MGRETARCAGSSWARTGRAAAGAGPRADIGMNFGGADFEVDIGPTRAQDKHEENDHKGFACREP